MTTGNATVNRAGLTAVIGALLPLGLPTSPQSARLR